MTEPVLPEVGRVVASFGFARRKTWPFMISLVAMMAIGLARVWTHGLRDEWGLAFLLVLLPGFALFMLLNELRLSGPVLLIGESGMVDRRRGPVPIAWPMIQEATVRRRALTQGIRVVLTNGERYDLELNLLAADASVVMRHIQEQAAKDGPSANA